MIEIKRNCSSSVTDRGDKITFGSISITISGEFYYNFKDLMNEYPNQKPIELLRWLIETELI